MEELKNLLMEKVGLDETQGGGVVEVVTGFLQDKLPENMQGIVGSLMNGETPDVASLLGGGEGGEGGVGGALDAAKNLFGK